MAVLALAEAHLPLEALEAPPSPAEVTADAMHVPTEAPTRTAPAKACDLIRFAEVACSGPWLLTVRVCCGCGVASHGA